MLVKKPKLNATTIALDGGPLICMNYALEPTVKHLNTFLLHFFGTKDMAGPKRLSRAWDGILPMVLHFWAHIPATRLTREPIFLYEETTAFLAHELTGDQLDFIVMHELGHVTLDHPAPPDGREGDGSGCDGDPARVRVWRRRVRARPHAIAIHPAHAGRYRRGSRDRSGRGRFPDHWRDARLSSPARLRNRLDSKIRINRRMDTHPEAAQRLDRLELINLDEYRYTSPLQRYATEFLQSVLDHAAAMNDDGLLVSVNAALE
jgi:hypothetical protein